MTTLTVQEKAEALRRTIAATQANIDQQESALADLKSVHRRNLLDLRAAEHAERMYTSTEARFKRATKVIRSEGIAWRSNVRQCCRGCVEPSQIGLASYDDKSPYAWTFGGQGAAILWTDGEPRPTSTGWRDERPTHAYINWGNGAAEKVVAAFQAEGFEVAWNGTEGDTVTVTL